MASSAPASSPAQLVNGGAVSSKETFRRVYDLLKKPLLEDSEVFSYTPESREWIEKMLDYNVPKGKLNRGLSVVDSLILLRSGEKLSEDDTLLACALGWCIEWLQAYFLVLDDIMDGSETRRGQPCWYKTLMPGSKINKVDLVAVNDGILLRNHIPQILKRYFRHKPYYLELRELFDEIEYQTACGQMLDLITTPQGEVDLSKYVMETYSRIVQYKTAYYSFYLPVACALYMSGEQDKDKFDSAKSILVRMGTYFQIQDDYLDCYGDPEVIGKIGTDIQDTKCSWLVVQAIARATPEQKQRILSKYGKKDDVAVAEVKKIYGELNLEKVYRDYEQASYDELIEEIDKEESVELQHVLKSFLAKIYKRKN